ncbi:MAG: hypothetical protein ABIO72_00765 [Patescibacteria group bacterium]
MSDRTKKILFAIGFILLSISIGIALYVFFFRPLVSPTPTTPTEQPPTGSLPTSGGAVIGGAGETPTEGQGLPTSPTIPTTPEAPTVENTNTIVLRDSVTQAVTAGIDGNGARFYSPDDGRFYRVNADGTISTISERQFFNVQDVEWAKKQDTAILEFPDGRNIYFNFKEDRQVTLPQHWQDFSFSPDDSRITAEAIGLDPSNRFLFVSNSDGNEAHAVEALGQNAKKTIVNWSPNSQVIAFSMTGNAQPEGAQEILLIGENHENFKSLIVPGRGFQPNWSPTGNNILYSVYHERDQLKPSLWVSGGSADSIGENRRSLNLMTWADKCTWQDENVLYCGVPQTLDAGAGFDESRFASTPDDLYRVDLRTGISVKVNTADQTHPIRQPVLSKDHTSFLFTDAVSGHLYEYKLPTP